jgi:hypothetical protein
MGCAPVLERSDAATMASKVRHTILLIDPARESRASILRAEVDLLRAGATIAGAILINRPPTDLEQSGRLETYLTVSNEPSGNGRPGNGTNRTRSIARSDLVNHQS